MWVSSPHGTYTLTKMEMQWGWSQWRIMQYRHVLKCQSVAFPGG